MNNFNLDFISLEEIYLIIKKKLHLLIIIPLITTIFSFIFTFYIIKPQYSVYTKVFVGKAETQDHVENYNNDDVQMYFNLLKTYSEIVKTNKLVSAALSNYNINISPSDALSHLSCIPTSDTQILIIKYQSSDKELAGRVVTAVTSEFIKTAEDLIPNGTVKVVEDVIIPVHPTKPNKILNLSIGLFLGIGISSAIIFLQEFLDNTFKNKEKLKRITSLSVLGSIPDEFLIGRNKKRRSRRKHNTLIMETASNSIVSEAYRTLQTNIKYSSASKKIQVLLITSSNMQEGKSTIASNLALSFSEEKNKVLIIDCDFRNPSLHKQFQMTNTKGLADIILNNEKFEDTVQKYSDNLYLLTAGKVADNPASMLSSKSMNNLLADLKKEFDLIILDSTPVLAVTDAQILSTKVDGTLIVVRYGSTKIQSVIECKNSIEIVGGNILGTVLHGIEINKKQHYTYTPSK